VIVIFSFVSMAAAVKVSVFMGGDRNFLESVEEYLEDVEAAALSWDSYCSPHMVIDAEATDKTKIRFFRQNLGPQGDAWHWWHYVLEDKKKSDWKEITAEFTVRYGSKVTQAASLFEVQNEIISLCQEGSQHITDYVREVEKLSRRVPKEMDSLLGISFIKGMRDESRRERVSFDLKDSPNFTFSRALAVVKAAYRIIGEPDPFNPKNRSLHDNGNGNGNGKQPEDFGPPLYASPDFQMTSRPTSSIHASQSYSMPPKTGARFVVPLANQLAEEKTGMSQEGFNAMMRNFMSTMGFSASKQAEQTATSRQPAFQFRQAGSYRPGVRASPVCYNCGNRGHYSDACTSPALSPYERQRIRDIDRVERESRDAVIGGQQHATGSNSVELPQQARRSGVPSPEVGLSSPDGLPYDPLSPRTQSSGTLPVAISPRPTTSMFLGEPSTSACVKTCSIGRRNLGEACAILARIPAVATIFEKALVEKRARIVEDDEDEEDGGHRATRQRVAESERGTRYNTRWRRDQPVINVEEEERRFLDSGVQTEKATRKKEGEKTLAPPINWMKGERQYTIQDALVGPGLNPVITLPQLLDCSPRLRRDLAELLRSSLPRTRKKKGAEIESSEVPATGMTVRVAGSPEVLSEALPDNGQETECLYIEAWVGSQKIPDVLVDGGAMLELISKDLVKRLGLVRYPVDGLAIRLADDQLIPLHFYVWLDIVVAGVLARIKAYEVEVSHTYQLLLSRRWLRQVKAVEYHSSQTLFLEGSDFVRRRTSAVPMARKPARESLQVKSLEVSCESPLEVDDEEAEEAVEALLNELDHWDQVVETREFSNSGN